MLKSIFVFLLTPIFLFALNAPTNLQVQATSQTTVTLDWTDNSPNETGFKIYRDGHIIALTSAGITHFEDTNLNPHTTYTYLVYATDYVEPELITDKNIYAVGEHITTHFQHFEDINWIGIYPMAEPDDNSDAANWFHKNDDRSIGSETWAGRNAAGYYEVRAFDHANVKKASYAFKVEAQPQDKRLILAPGSTGWITAMAPNLILRHDQIMQLPFDGYVMPGNHYTDYLMSNNVVTYAGIMNETVDNYPQKISEIAGLYQGKDMFLSVWIKFPGDLWDDAVWAQVTANFGVIAKVAKDLGFKGIAFDDEGYGTTEKRMINFKFPTTTEVTANPNGFAEWERNGAQPAFADSDAYRNLNFTFENHMDKTITRAQDIMAAMVAEYPAIDVLVYHGPTRAHSGTYQYIHKGHKLSDSHIRFYEFKGSFFTGLKRGLGAQAHLYDMGEMYQYRTNEHFARDYQWRKYGMAKDSNNDALDPSYQWRIPTQDRINWKDTVNVGSIIFNKEERHSFPEYNTSATTNFGDIKTDLTLALSHADKYVIYYCHDQEWLMPGHNNRPYIGSLWENMVREAMQ